MIVPFSALNKRHRKNKKKFTREFRRSLDQSEFILGNSVEMFEKDFSDYVGSKFAVGVGNGSDALRIALLAKHLPNSGNVLLSANTYFAAGAAVAHVGLRPRFYDVSLENRFPTSEQIESTRDSETVAIIRSHLFGEVDACAVKDLTEIHDCSQSHGTLINNAHVGAGNLSTFSLYPGKNLGAFGDAGIITTDSMQEFESVKMYRNQGTTNDRYLHEVIGFNSRLDSIQSRMLRIKLSNLDSENERRIKLAKTYRANLQQHSAVINLFPTIENSKSTYHLFQVYVPDFDISFLQEKLLTYGVSTGRHYPIPLHLQPAFKYLGYSRGDFPNAELLAKYTISLPLYPEMKKNQVDYICEKLLEILK